MEGTRRVAGEEEQIAALVRSLAVAGDGDGAARDALEREVRACFARWSAAGIRDYLPIFVERCAREGHRSHGGG